MAVGDLPFSVEVVIDEGALVPPPGAADASSRDEDTNGDGWLSDDDDTDAAVRTIPLVLLPPPVVDVDVVAVLVRRRRSLKGSAVLLFTYFLPIADRCCRSNYYMRLLLPLILLSIEEVRERASMAIAGRDEQHKQEEERIQ